MSGQTSIEVESQLFVSILVQSVTTNRLYVCRYVDEVQDNLIIDARRMFHVLCSNGSNCYNAVLRLICGNPHGLFWAGGKS